MKKLLITGASGFLGWNIIQSAKSDWIIFGTFLTHPLDTSDCKLIKIDLTNFHYLKQLFNQIKPNAVIHTAAISDTNFCQKNRSVSYKIKNAKLNPLRQKDLNMPAPRPPDVSLNSSKAMTLGFWPDTIKTELEYLQKDGDKNIMMCPD
jgi:dTDP-4-dehydrorhamnose reductase